MHIQCMDWSENRFLDDNREHRCILRNISVLDRAVDQDRHKWVDRDWHIHRTVHSLRIVMVTVWLLED